MTDKHRTAPYGFWLTNTGEFKPVTAMNGHLGTLTDLGLEENRDLAFNNGWVRGVFHKDTQVIEIEYSKNMPLSNFQLNQLKKLLVEWNYLAIEDIT